MKKLLLFFSAMCCMMVANATNPDATKIEYKTGKFMYFILDETNHTATVTWGGESNYDGTPDYTGSITIPSKVNYGDTQYSVTCVGEYAFKYCLNLESVTLPNGLKSISGRTFEHCDNLTSITLPDGLDSIGYCAFRDCAITSINIPSSVITTKEPVDKDNVW